MVHRLRTMVGWAILGLLVWAMVVHPLYTVGVLLVGHGMVWLYRRVGRGK